MVGKTSTITVDAILFDMDGTLIDSTPGVIKAWHTFGEKYDLDVPLVLKETHGVRLIDSLRTYCKITDERELANESIRFEEEVIAGGPVILPGVANLLAQLKDGAPDGKTGWTIVTSATSFYAPPALLRAGIELPPTIVTSEDVPRGKPFPDPYVQGAVRLQTPSERCLVVEDAPSGIRSGKAAGSKTLAVLTSHDEQHMRESGANPDWIVKDLTHVSVKWVDGRINVSIDESL